MKCEAKRYKHDKLNSLCKIYVKNAEIRRKIIKCIFINLHAVHNNNAIARLLLPLLQHAEQRQYSKVVGW